ILFILLLLAPFIIPADAYKDLIIKRVEGEIAGNLSIGSMKIRLIPHPGFTLQDVSLTNSSGAFKDQPIVKAKRVAGSVALFPLFARTLAISFELDAPEIYLRNEAKGKSNIDQLLHPHPAKNTHPHPPYGHLPPSEGEGQKGSCHWGHLPPSEGEGQRGNCHWGKGKVEGQNEIGILPSAYAAGEESPSKPWKISIQNFEIDDGVVNIENPDSVPTIISKIEFKLTDVKYTLKGAQSHLKIAAALMNSPEQNLQLSGTLTFMDTNINPVSISGALNSVTLKFDTYLINDLNMIFSYKDSQLNIGSLSAMLYNGKLNAKGKFNLGESQKYNLESDITAIDLSIFPATKDFMKGIGSLNLNIGGSGASAFDPRKGMRGQGSMHLDKGEIYSLRLGKEIFGDKVWDIPAKLGIGLNPATLNELRGLDASCEDFDATFSLSNGIVSTPSVRWRHQKYRIILSGYILQDETLRYDGTFLLGSAITSKLFKGKTSQSIMLNEAGEMPIPFKIAGTLPKPEPKVDDGYLSSIFTRMAEEFLVNKTGDLIKNSLPKTDIKSKIEGLFGK
ncbi:MAG: AsmA family protein, partial [Pseudomonadota bacterium]